MLIQLFKCTPFASFQLEMPLLPRDVPAYASLLQLCSNSKNLHKLQQLHAQTIKLSISYNDFIRAKLISAYSSCSQMSDAHFIFSRCNRESTFLYNTLIRGYASINNFHLSLSCFQQMILYGKEIDPNTLPAVIKSVAAFSDLRLGKTVHGYVLRYGFWSDLAHCNSLITMYGKCRDLWSARKVFDEMPDRNMITWCAMMGGYEMNNECLEVFGLFDRFLSSGEQLDGVVFTVVLTACSHAGMVEKGKEIFKMMTEEFRVRPSMEHYTCMVDMLGRAGSIEEAKDIIEKMNIEPDEALLRALFKACRFHGIHDITVRGKYFDLLPGRGDYLD